MINYRRLSDSLEFYETHGFKRIEAPWWVSKQILDITTPPGANHYYLDNNKKCLVASGEQGFLYIAAKDRLPPGKYQTITPCFRDESIGTLHRKCFMKNELIITDVVTEAKLLEVVDTCKRFFEGQVPYPYLLQVVKTNDGYDITYWDIELGSYGIRHCEFLSWIYATGLAEPRMTRAIQSVNYRLTKNERLRYNETRKG